MPDYQALYNPYYITQTLRNKMIKRYWTCSDRSIAFIDKSFGEDKEHNFVNQLAKLLGATDPQLLDNVNFEKPTIKNQAIGVKLSELGLVTQNENGYFIPNLEVREAIIEYLNKHIFLTESNYQEDMVPCLINKNLEGFLDLVKKFFNGLPRNFNLEASYRDSLYIFLSMYKGELKDIGLEEPAGSGRCDLRIDFPNQNLAYIFELKLLSYLNRQTLENFKKAANAGLNQIKNHNYWSYYTGKEIKFGIKSLFIVGLTFLQDSFYAVYEELEMSGGKRTRLISANVINGTRFSEH